MKNKKKIIFLLLYLFFLLSKAESAENNFLDGIKNLKISGELRTRLESRVNFDFNDNIDDNDTFYLSRLRLNFRYNFSEIFSTFLQLQDSRIWDSRNFRYSSSFRDELDIRQGYIDFNILEDSFKEITLRVGRQELSYGDQRLVGGFNWSNVAQSFDAIKIVYKRSMSEEDQFKIEGFASRKVIVDTRNSNNWDDQDNLYGMYGTYYGVDNHILDLYYLLRKTTKHISFGPNVGSGKLEENTLGFRLRGEGLQGFDYTLEYARQFGDFGSQDIKAFALVALVGYTFDHPWQPRIGVEWDFATGDESSTDNERNTFDNLWPTNHMHYGYMDRASWQNLNSYRFTFSLKPTSKLYFQLDYHRIYLDETTDSLYNAGRKAVRTAATSNVDDFVGSELDLLLKCKLYKGIKLLAGYSHFFAGDFLRDTGADDNGDFFYLQTSFNF